MITKDKLANPIFLISIVTLILNDCYLKYSYHNLVTGKLSDFAGLFAFPFFWSVIFPNRSKIIHIATAFIFVFWKSDFSQPLIDLINSTGLYVFRTIDYYDCLALISIVFSYSLVVKASTFRLRPLVFKVLCSLTIFSLVATTQKREMPANSESYKMITINNQGAKKLYVLIDFEYSKADISNATILNNEFNRSETVIISGFSGDRITTPILQDQKIKFPKTFKLTVFDSLGNTIKLYDKRSFLVAVDKHKDEIINEFSNYWTLTIGEKVPDKFENHTLYGRWKTLDSVNKKHSFEVRKGYYYDIDPDSDILKYSIEDSTISIDYLTKKITGKIIKLHHDTLAIRWLDKGLMKYHKLYN